MKRYCVEVFPHKILSASENEKFAFYTGEGRYVDDLDVAQACKLQTKYFDTTSHLKKLIKKGRK